VLGLAAEQQGASNTTTLRERAGVRYLQTDCAASPSTLVPCKRLTQDRIQTSTYAAQSCVPTPHWCNRIIKATSLSLSLLGLPNCFNN